MNFENFGCNNSKPRPDKCCPRVVFAVLPTGTTPSGSGPTGPTGPIGPTGPSSTITVGTTTTTAPGTEATVTNVGTTTDAVLNFTIPEGPTGPTGEAGPQGVAGPAGETGPTGPQGPANGLNAYGGLYSTTTQQFTTQTATPTGINLGTTMEVDNVTTTSPNTVTIIEPGDYEITYNVVAQIGSTANVTVALQKDSNNIEGTSTTLALTNAEPELFSNRIITNLSTGDNITLVLTSSVDSTTGSVNSANLTIKQLN